MSDYSYVKGDEYISERRYLIQDENRIAVWMINIPAVLALTCLAIYGFLGGKGWLAAGVFLTGSWISIVIYDRVRRVMFVLGSIEHRLRIIEADTDATIRDIEHKNRHDRESNNRREREC